MPDNEKREVYTSSLHEAFPPNSKEGKAKSEKLPTDKKLEKVVTGTVTKKKRSFGKKLVDTFVEDDTRSVADYIIHDVLIHAAKTMICDMVGWGGMAEMILFGSNNGKRTRRENGRSFTSYGSMFKSGNANRSTRDNRDISKTGRARHDFDEIVLETRGEAEDVLSHLVDLTIDYGQATVADLYDLVGVTSQFTDNKYGWTDLKDASVNRVRDGYLINLPRTQVLN